MLKYKKIGDLNTGQRLNEMEGEDEDNRPGSHCRKGLDVQKNNYYCCCTTQMNSRHSKIMGNNVDGMNDELMKTGV